ncbi:TSUP family transporter, partial [Xylella fastidiosa subsp. multiplex]|uniref:TSUP family transporter n=1 Tax=Xylella fastidiosa TaxID=2371 RepID=UPI0020C1BE12
GRATAPHAEHHQNVLRMCMKTSSVSILTGAASGFFGIGGGFLIVPALIFATRMPTINAIGSSLLAVVTFVLITTLNYARHDLVDWRIALEFIVGGITGGGIGTM